MANPNIVNVATINAGNAGWNLGTGLTDTLLTVGADVVVKINTIICSIVDGTNDADLNLLVDGMGSGVPTDAVATGGDATVYLAKTVSVPADTSLSVIDSPIYLMENDILKGGASAASDLDLFISYEVLNDA